MINAKKTGFVVKYKKQVMVFNHKESIALNREMKEVLK